MSKKMVAVTALQNPNAPAGQQISLYYNLNNQNLALEQRNEGEKADPPTDAYVSSETDQTGWIENPSQVAGTELNGIPIVFGFTAKKPDPDSKDPPTEHDVSILSPVYRPVGSTLVDNISIAATTSGSMASVFYLTGGKGNFIDIEERQLGEQNPVSWKGHSQIMEGSSLAAYITDEGDGPIRRVIYQADDDSDLYDFEPDGGLTKISHADAKDRSPLAVAVSNGKAYLYYLNSHNELQRIIKSDISKPKSWGSSDPIKGAQKVDESSFLTVVSAGKHNHIFYVAKGKASTVFEHIRDPQ